MERQRFDWLARGLGARTSRREAIAWLGSVVLGALVASRTTGRVAAQSSPGGYGDPCELVVESCQPPFTCFEAICDLPRGCVGEGLPCVEGFPCCPEDGLTCIDGSCAVALETALPATGVGIPDDSERVAGLALAGAAVVVAGKLIRDKERDPEL